MEIIENVNNVSRTDMASRQAPVPARYVSGHFLKREIPRFFPGFSRKIVFNPSQDRVHFVRRFN